MSNLTDTNPLEGYVTKETLWPLRDVRFEGMLIPGLHDNETYLSTTYGDFMQLPPPDDRKMHKPYILKLGESDEVENQKQWRNEDTIFER